MKILQGIYTPTSGTMIFDGKPLELKTIYHALEAGISMIHQEMSPIPDMTVAENIFWEGNQRINGDLLTTNN